MSKLDTIIDRNRLDAMRHMARGVAFAAAASASVIGCTESHVSGPIVPRDGGPLTPDGGAVARDAALFYDASRDQGALRDAGRTDFGTLDIGVMPWTLPCDATGAYGELAGLSLPTGVDGIAVYLSRGEEVPAVITYVAGDFCESRACPAPGAGGFRPPYYWIMARRGDDYATITLQELLPNGVTNEAQAALAALEAETVLSCTGAFPSGVAPTDDGFQVLGRTLMCSWTRDLISARVVSVASDAAVAVTAEYATDEYLQCNVVFGRLTDGALAGTLMQAPRPAALSAPAADAGDYFARGAWLEAQAVDAFERMARELRELGAPEQLVAWARLSADDERRHAHEMGQLAAHFGATPPAHSACTHPSRGLFEVALENAVEGCVRETLGAVVGHYQAAHANDAHVRHTLERIAEDETAHAALSWAVAEWADTVLTSSQRTHIAAARASAVASLTGGMLAGAHPPNAREVAGLPSEAVAAEMIAQLKCTVWA